MLYQGGITSLFWSGGKPLALYDLISFLFSKAERVGFIPLYPDLPNQQLPFSNLPVSEYGVRLRLSKLEEKESRILLRAFFRKCWVERNQKRLPAIGIERRIEADR